MLRTCLLALTIFASLAWMAPDAEAVYRPRLLDTPAAALDGPAPDLFDLGALDTGGGAGSSSDYVTQGCFSLLTSFGVALVVSVGVVVVFISSLQSTADLWSVDIEKLTTTLILLSLGMAVVTPLATSAVVTGMAAASGASPNYWLVYLASAGTRLVIGVVSWILPPVAAALSVAAVLAPPAVEVYVANFVGQSGGAGDTPARRRLLSVVAELHRPVLAAADRRIVSDRAPAVSLLSYAF